MLRTFDYSGVSLGPGRWQKQYQSARDFYLGVSNDDILHGFRREAGLSAPGKPLGGWAARNSATVFGQWLQAMARASKGNADPELRFRFKGQDEASQRDDFQPFDRFAELERYRMYFDPSMRTDLW